MSTDDLKRQAAARAVEQVQDGMKLGLGTAPPPSISSSCLASA
jgi:ribose 5-phosphate isomerase